MSRDTHNLAILFIILTGLIFGAVVLSKSPRDDRDWKEQFSNVAVFHETSADRYSLAHMRDYQFSTAGAATPAWRAADLEAANIEEMWFFIEPFPDNPLFAHSFLSFVFEDETGARQTVSVSIEARMEERERYSPLAGVLRNYELMYVWSTERDILTRIAVGLDHTVYAYRLKLEQDQMRRLFTYFVRRTNELAERPRFYNTLHSNCTNELAKAVNEAFPKALPWNRSWVFTGRSAAWLYDLGFIADREAGSFRSLTNQSDIKDAVQTHASSPAFSDAWRASFSAGASSKRPVKTQ